MKLLIISHDQGFMHLPIESTDQMFDLQKLKPSVQHQWSFWHLIGHFFSIPVYICECCLGCEHDRLFKGNKERIMALRK